jgi:hypothetical protein|tara:strand:+ start:461 stop:655 length:195 start_codon:yes stop_codon:yes gene_type:complete
VITPDDMKEFNRQFGDIKITELEEAMPETAEGMGNSSVDDVDPVVETLAEILSVLESINEFIRQ